MKTANVTWTEHFDIVRKKRMQSLLVLALLLLLTGIHLFAIGIGIHAYPRSQASPWLLFEAPIAIALNLAMMTLIVFRMRLWMATSLKWSIEHLDLILDSSRKYTLDELGGFAEVSYDGQHAIRFFPKLRLTWIESVFWASIGIGSANVALVAILSLATPRAIPLLLGALLYVVAYPTLFMLALKRFSDPIRFPVTIPPEVDLREVQDALRLRLTKKGG